MIPWRFGNFNLSLTKSARIFSITGFVESVIISSTSSFVSTEKILLSCSSNVDNSRVNITEPQPRSAQVFFLSIAMPGDESSLSPESIP